MPKNTSVEGSSLVVQPQSYFWICAVTICAVTGLFYLIWTSTLQADLASQQLEVIIPQPTTYISRVDHWPGLRHGHLRKTILSSQVADRYTPKVHHKLHHLFTSAVSGTTAHPNGFLWIVTIASTFLLLLRKLTSRQSTLQKRQPLSIHCTSFSGQKCLGTPQWQELHQWMETKGGDCGSKVTDGDFRFSEDGPAVRGIGAPYGAAANQVLLSLPRSLALVAPNNSSGLPDTMALSALLAAERSKGSSSEWAPYIATLPSEVRTPLLMVAQGTVAMEDLQYSPAVRALDNMLQEARRGFELLSPDSGVDWFSFLQAVSLVHSRTFRMKGLKLMLPGIDMLNHGGDQKNCGLGMTTPVWDSDPSGGIIQIIATKEISPGAQVLWNYGDRCNDDFFFYYGFTLPHNPFDGVELFESITQAQLWHASTFPDAKPATQPSFHQPGSQVGYNGADFSVLTDLKDPVKEAKHLASFRLHCIEWGTDKERDTVSELIVRRNGMVDSRLLELFTSLGGPSGAECVRQRAAHLLESYATSSEDDTQLLASGVSEDMQLVISYRLQKKMVLKEVIAALT